MLSEKLPIQSVGKRFVNLDRSEGAANVAVETGGIKKLIFDGYQKLIIRFNQVNVSDEVVSLMPNVEALKQILEGNSLPNLEELRPKDVNWDSVN